MPENENPAPNQQPQPVFVQLPATEPAGDVDVEVLIDAFRSSLKPMLVVVIGVPLLILALSFFMSREYRGEVAVIPVESGASANLVGASGSLGGLAALAGIDLGSDSSGREALAILESRNFLGTFIAERGIEPELAAEARGLLRDEPTRNDVVAFFRDRVLQVIEDSDAGLILIRVQWKDREVAADWANGVVAAVNTHIRARKIAEAEQSIEFLKRERQKSSIVEVQIGIDELIQQQIETIMLANVRTEYAFDVIDPAIVPDEDDYVRPRHAAWTSIAFVAMLLLSVTWVVLRALVGTSARGAARPDR